MQHKIFMESEGDAWYARNKDRLGKDTDWPLELMRRNYLKPRNVFEVGCADGFRLAKIAELYGSQCDGCDVSLDAVLSGEGNISLRRRSAHDTWAVTANYDLVIINFVFHWIDRLYLLRTAAEADRLLCANGYMIIGDFAVVGHHKKLYHHLPEHGVWTYKTWYPGLFVNTGLYKVIDQEVYPLDGKTNAYCVLLQKGDYYKEER